MPVFCAPLPRTTGCDGDEYAGCRAQSEPGTVRAGARDLPNIPPEPSPERPVTGASRRGRAVRPLQRQPCACVRGARSRVPVRREAQGMVVVPRQRPSAGVRSGVFLLEGAAWQATANGTNPSPARWTSRSWRPLSSGPGAKLTCSTGSTRSTRTRPCSSSTRGRPPRTAAPASTTCSPARSRTSSSATRPCAASAPCAAADGTPTALPVELEIEKELGISSKQEIEEFGIEEFNRRCRESVFRYVGEWEAMTERAGVWLDMADAYVTYHNSYIESAWWVLQAPLGQGPRLRGLQGDAPLPPLRHEPQLPRGRPRLPGGHARPQHLHPIPRERVSVACLTARRPAHSPPSATTADAGPRPAPPSSRGRRRPGRSPRTAPSPSART